MAADREEHIAARLADDIAVDDDGASGYDDAGDDLADTAVLETIDLEPVIDDGGFGYDPYNSGAFRIRR